MSFPKTLEVIIEGDDKESRSSLLRLIPWAGLGDMSVAEFITENGRKFCIDKGYINECQKEHKPPHIPLQVINTNSASEEKLRLGREALEKQQKAKDTGLILPDANPL